MFLCCCSRLVAVQPALPAPLTPDLVADLPPHTRDSSAFTTYNEADSPKKRAVEPEGKSLEGVIVGATTEIDLSTGEVEDTPLPPRSPSIHVEDYSEKSNRSLYSVDSHVEPFHVEAKVIGPDFFGSQESLAREPYELPGSRSVSRKSPSVASKNISASSSPIKSRNTSPDPTSAAYNEHPHQSERDVRSALAECIVPARHEDWEVIVNGLIETERLALDSTARAPAASWRAAVRAASAHVRSLRSRVARAACSALGALFEHRGRALDPELEEAATALLERCADVNRFLRADAASALIRLAYGSNGARAAVALSRRGATHRAGPVRAAAAQALARLVQHNGASRTLDMPPEPRTVLLRAAGELLADASADTRLHARHLCVSLSTDPRFRPMLKDAMLPSRYRAIEKLVDKLR